MSFLARRRLAAAATLLALATLLVPATCGCGGGGEDGGNGADTPPDPAWFIPASLVIGQTDFTSGLPNQGNVTPGAATVGLPLGAFQVSTIAGDPSYLCDTFSHRVLGFNVVPTTNGAPADFVLGQINFTNNTPGGGASQFGAPARVIASGGKLFVCDSNNNRVLIWNTLPSGFGPADVVVGQPNFVANAAATTQSGLDSPIAVAVGGGKLVVADTGNNRILVWNAIPVANGVPADVVVGQLGFLDSIPNAGGFLSPAGLAAPLGLWTDGTRLVVADTFNNRVSIWNAIPTSSAEEADVVLGQPHFFSSLPAAGADGLWEPTDVTSDGTRLFVADARNDRVLVWNAFPTVSGTPADHVLGQSDFLRQTENDDNQDGTPDATPSARTFFAPTGLAIVGSRLWVTDYGNSRVLAFDLP